MPSAETLTPEKRFMGMLVGPTKAGKSCLAASFRDNDDQVIEFLDFDGRINGLLGAPWLSRRNINYTYYPPRMKNLVDVLYQKLEVWETYAANNQYANLPTTVVLDSITSETITLLFQALPLTHQKAERGTKQTGKFIGNFAMPDPGDYGYQAQVTYGILSFFRSIPIKNVIVTGHLIPVYGKKDPDNPYSDSQVIGQRLSLTDKVAANVGIYFDHMFELNRYESAGKQIHTVKFWSDFASTSYPNMPTGAVNVTGKNFYKEILLPLIKEPVDPGEGKK